MLKIIIGIQALLIVLPMVLLSGLWITFPVSGFVSQEYSGAIGLSLTILNIVMAIIAFFAAGGLFYLSLSWIIASLQKEILVLWSLILVKAGIIISVIGTLALIYHLIWDLRTDPAQILTQYVFGIVLIPTAIQQIYLNRVNKPLKNDAQNARAF